MHDLGGMQGFGPVEVEADEPVFHAEWERRAFRLTIAAMLAGHLNGRFRHAIERMDPAWYLASPYYEHWLTATATGLVEGGVITQDELDERLGAPYPGRPPGPRARGSTNPGPRWTPTASRWVTRCGCANGTRWATRGRPATCRASAACVVRLDGVFSLPDVEYHCDQVRMRADLLGALRSARAVGRRRATRCTSTCGRAIWSRGRRP